VQILRGQDNRFAQSCERSGVDGTDSTALRGYADAAASDLSILQRLAVDDETLLGWIEGCERLSADEGLHESWAAAGANCIG
jgi:hypothetical protein